MIPHHSMAVHMSKKLLRKQNNIQNFLENLITTQEDEINFLKKLLGPFKKELTPKYQALFYKV